MKVPRKSRNLHGRWKEKFIAALSETGIVRESARLAGVTPKTAHVHRQKDEKFAEAWSDAVDQAADVLEREAWRRASEGLIQKKFCEGVPIIDPSTGEHYFERSYSDTLLIFLLKGIRPSKYRENHHLTGDGTAAAAPSTIIITTPLTR